MDGADNCSVVRLIDRMIYNHNHNDRVKERKKADKQIYRQKKSNKQTQQNNQTNKTNQEARQRQKIITTKQAEKKRKEKET